jgi:NAD-dependent dihydropyrimidine dehydrogenase PreA subunit
VNGELRSVYSITELKDATAANPKFDESLGDEFFDLWDAWFDSDEPRQLIEKAPRRTGRTEPVMRIIAKWKSIKDTPGVLPCDDIRELLRVNTETLAINNCSCLRISKKRAPDIPEELCFIIDKTAQYCIDRGTARRITLKEAMDILKQTEKYPLVHITYNVKPMLRLIGNCGNYCIVFRWSPPRIIRNCAPSRFQAKVNPEMCLGCKTCVELCLFGAAQIKHYPELDVERAYIDTEKCMGCGNCVILCPIGAITMRLVQPPEFIPDEYVGNY